MRGTRSARRWVLAVTSLASLLVVLDALVVSTALNSIRVDLDASVAQLEWTVNAYVLSFAVLLMTGPRSAIASGAVARLAVLGERLPVELDDVAEPLGVVAPPDAEPLGADPVLVRARRPSLYLLVSCASASPVGHGSAPRAARSRKPREPGAGP
jgi:MFS family permease